MIEEPQVQLQRVLKQKTREAVCAYLAKTDGSLAKDFLSELVVIGNDDSYKLQLRECLDGHFYVELAYPNRTIKSSIVLYADNVASPYLTAFMRFCEGAESHNPKSCAIFWLERLFRLIKPKNSLLAKNQLDAAIARINTLDDGECIDFVNNSLSDFIKDILL